MISFKNDYSSGCIPEIIDLLKKTNNNTYLGFGMDKECEAAKQIIHSKMPDNDVDIHFIPEETTANLTIIRAALRSYQAVIACDTADIVIRETGAIEATGHSLSIVHGSDGKVTPQAIQESFDTHMLMYEKMTYPKMVYISNATELGTVYSGRELAALHDKCTELDLYLMMNGARLNTALMSGVDYTLNDLPKWVDVFTIGGTRAGALFGQAVVICNPELRQDFRFVMKQSGASLSKGWLLGLQFQGLFENDSFYKYAAYELETAKQIQQCLHNLGYPLLVKSQTNLIFPVITTRQFDYLSKLVDFEVWEKQNDQYVIRLVTAFHTTQEDVNTLCEYLEEAAKLEIKKKK